eukprot:scaffold246642_cov26-Tisochrysis_lutea.AAC.1
MQVFKKDLEAGGHGEQCLAGVLPIDLSHTLLFCYLKLLWSRVAKRMPGRCCRACPTIWRVVWVCPTTCCVACVFLYNLMCFWGLSYNMVGALMWVRMLLHTQGMYGCPELSLPLLTAISGYLALAVSSISCLKHFI